MFRLNWKNDIIKSMNLPIIHLLISDDLEKFNYRHVKIDGVLSNVELYVFAGQHGYYILSPMLLTTGNYMLINKGITSEKKEREVKVKKVVTEGVLYCDSKNQTKLSNRSTLILNSTIRNLEKSKQNENNATTFYNTLCA